jgi:AcrR family transcriptional regulator
MKIRPMLPDEVVDGFKRRRVTDAISELSVERGYRATTIAHVARRAKVARNTIYGYFPNKEAIFLSALDEGIVELLVGIEAACAAAPAESGPQIEAGLGAVLRYVSDKPAAAWTVMVEARSATEPARDRYQGALQQFAGMLRQCAPKGASRPESIEDSLIGGVAAVLDRLLRRGEAKQAPELLPDLSAFLMAPYIADSRPKRKRKSPRSDS